MVEEQQGGFDEAESDERDWDKKSTDPRVDSSAELILALTKPTVEKRYGKFVSRDLAVSNIPKRSAPLWIPVIRRHVSIISDFLFMDLSEMANVYNADLKTILNVLRSIDGFERKQQSTITTKREGYGGLPVKRTGRFGLKK